MRLYTLLNRSGLQVSRAGTRYCNVRPLTPLTKITHEILAAMNTTKTTSPLSTGLILGGFLLIVLAWSGAASTRYVDAQIPFLISGGLTGIGLVGCGCALGIIQELRKAAALLAGRLDAMGVNANADGAPTAPADTLPESRVPAASTIERGDAVIETAGR
jgi:hypothetical protein